MKKSLITYSTVDGQTKEICEKISELSNNSFIDILPINKVGNIAVSYTHLRAHET